MMETLYSILDKLILTIPNSNIQIFGFPIGLYTWKLTILIIAGEAIVMLTKPKKAV